MLVSCQYDLFAIKNEMFCSISLDSTNLDEEATNLDVLLETLPTKL